MEAPTLISPDYSKEFHIFSFASGDTLAAVLLQKDDDGSEYPVAFFSKTLMDAELRYDTIEKQAYAYQIFKGFQDIHPTLQGDCICALSFSKGCPNVAKC